ncbi:MAG: hypothetical protein JSS69_09770 [Acidobacteria bacterium]|nr:hypothetical protein [Acidobacteriota bacterium]MBS1866189.1 hypothetical protein [Acidobacteriota bacterium]
MVTSLALLFPVLCILVLAGKIVPGWPGPMSTASRNRRVRVSTSRVVNPTRISAIDEVVHDGY